MQDPHGSHSIARAGSAPISFPATRRVLWDRSTRGAAKHLCIDAWEPSVAVAPGAVRALAQRLLAGRSAGAELLVARCRAVGRSRSRLAVSVERLLPTESALKWPDVHLDCDEIPVRCFLRYADCDQPLAGDEARPASCEMEAVIQARDDRAQKAGPLRPGDSLAWAAIVAVDGRERRVHIRMFAAFPRWTFSFMLLATPLRTLQNPLLAHLQSVQRPSSLGCGFLTLDQGRRVVCLQEEDSLVGGVPLVGVWVDALGGVDPRHISAVAWWDAAEVVDSPLVWAAAARFIHSQLIPERVWVAERTFLVMIVHYITSSENPDDNSVDSGAACPRSCCSFFEARYDDSTPDAVLVAPAVDAEAYDVDGPLSASDSTDNQMQELSVRLLPLSETLPGVGCRENPEEDIPPKGLIAPLPGVRKDLDSGTCFPSLAISKCSPPHEVSRQRARPTDDAIGLVTEEPRSVLPQPHPLRGQESPELIASTCDHVTYSQSPSSQMENSRSANHACPEHVASTSAVICDLMKERQAKTRGDAEAGQTEMADSEASHGGKIANGGSRLGSARNSCASDDFRDVCRAQMHYHEFQQKTPPSSINRAAVVNDCPEWQMPPWDSRQYESSKPCNQERNEDRNAYGPVGNSSAAFSTLGGGSTEETACLRQLVSMQQMQLFEMQRQLFDLHKLCAGMAAGIQSPEPQRKQQQTIPKRFCDAAVTVGASLEWKPLGGDAPRLQVTTNEMAVNTSCSLASIRADMTETVATSTSSSPSRSNSVYGRTCDSSATTAATASALEPTTHVSTSCAAEANYPPVLPRVEQLDLPTHGQQDAEATLDVVTKSFHAGHASELAESREHNVINSNLQPTRQTARSFCVDSSLSASVEFESSKLNSAASGISADLRAKNDAQAKARASDAALEPEFTSSDSSSAASAVSMRALALRDLDRLGLHHPSVVVLPDGAHEFLANASDSCEKVSGLQGLPVLQAPLEKSDTAPVLSAPTLRDSADTAGGATPPAPSPRSQRPQAVMDMNQRKLAGDSSNVADSVPRIIWPPSPSSACSEASSTLAEDDDGSGDASFEFDASPVLGLSLGLGHAGRLGVRLGCGLGLGRG